MKITLLLIALSLACLVAAGLVFSCACAYVPPADRRPELSPNTILFAASAALGVLALTRLVLVLGSRRS